MSAPNSSSGTHSHRTISVPVPLSIKVISLFLFLICITPFLMYVSWLLRSQLPLSIVFIDKTSMTSDGPERSSLYWALRHQKVVKRDDRFYLPSVDYLGFVPILDSTFTITGLETLTPAQIDSLADRTDAAYYIDTYGVLRSEWAPRDDKGMTQSALYGGLSDHDVSFISALRKRGKSVIAEFNFFASPTGTNVRQAAENLLGIQWTGWIGRYYATLDTSESDLPGWVVDRFVREKGSWNFRRAGVVLVHSSGDVLILDEGGLLTDPLPRIVTEASKAEEYGLAEEVPYPFWFDVTQPTWPNYVLSYFALRTNAQGDSLLSKNHLRNIFPAVIRSRGGNPFTYLAMDAADNPPPPGFLASLDGLDLLRQLFYTDRDATDRSQFYWDYYMPLIARVTTEINKRR